jgi:uncharacterized protein YjbJ (UPF0337 family)
MISDTTFEHWNSAREALLGRFPDLSEEDLIYEEGNEEQLVKNLQEKLGKSRNEIKQLLKSTNA